MLLDPGGQFVLVILWLDSSWHSPSSHFEEYNADEERINCLLQKTAFKKTKKQKTEFVKTPISFTEAQSATAVKLKVVCLCPVLEVDDLRKSR